MADDVVALVTAAPGVLVLGKWAFDRFVARAARTAEKVEAKEEKEAHDTETKLDQVLALLGKLEVEFARLGERFVQQAAAVDGLRDRIDGISQSHGPKLDALAERVTRLEERVRGKR